MAPIRIKLDRQKTVKKLWLILGSCVWLSILIPCYNHDKLDDGVQSTWTIFPASRSRKFWKSVGGFFREWTSVWCAAKPKAPVSGWDSDGKTFLFHL